MGRRSGAWGIDVIVLHGLWADDATLRLWGERPLAGPRLPKPRGPHAASGRPRRHPYAASAQELREALAELTSGDLAAGLAARELALFLPSSAETPLPSPDLPGGAEVAVTVEGLLPWRVAALLAPPTVALDLLLALPSEPSPPVRWGSTLAWLSQATTLAVELVARGRLLPDLRRKGRRHIARWTPFLDVNDRARLRVLTAAMPPACRAEQLRSPRGTGQGPSAEGRDPHSIVCDLLEHLVDVTARAGLEGRSLMPARRGRDPAPATAVELWLEALSGDAATVVADRSELELLGKQLQAWRRSGAGAGGPLRTCFRLVPPPPAWVPEEAADDDNGRWRLEFLLQAADDPSLLVPAAEVWQARPP